MKSSGHTEMILTEKEQIDCCAEEKDIPEKTGITKTYDPGVISA